MSGSMMSARRRQCPHQRKRRGGGLGGSVIIGSASQPPQAFERPNLMGMDSIYLDPSASVLETQRTSYQRMARSVVSRVQSEPDAQPQQRGSSIRASTAASTTATVIGSKWRCQMSAMAVLSAPSADPYSTSDR